MTSAVSRSIRGGKTNTWRGRAQPKRDRCPKCNKRGLGPAKMVSRPMPRPLAELPVGVYQECRYCRALTLVSSISAEPKR